MSEEKSLKMRNTANSHSQTFLPDIALFSVDTPLFTVLSVTERVSKEVSDGQARLNRADKELQGCSDDAATRMVSSSRSDVSWVVVLSPPWRSSARTIKPGKHELLFWAERTLRLKIVHKAQDLAFNGIMRGRMTTTMAAMT